MQYDGDKKVKKAGFQYHQLPSVEEKMFWDRCKIQPHQTDNDASLCSLISKDWQFHGTGNFAMPTQGLPQTFFH